ncbi:YjhX family toxin [Halocynthiibacter sp.]|uniref:YjhX family toxin n=1 Tax=Halocynthiibacter sp. TaxID=1979210 RepID=UPI003C5E10BF
MDISKEIWRVFNVLAQGGDIHQKHTPNGHLVGTHSIHHNTDVFPGLTQGVFVNLRHGPLFETRCSTQTKCRKMGTALSRHGQISLPEGG